MIIRIFDLETTGLAPPEHAPVEIGWCDLVSSDTSLRYCVRLPHAVLVDPERDIPPEASAVHHITAEDLAQHLPRWRDVAALWMQGPGFDDPDFIAMGDEPIDFLAAHNAKFERQWLTDDLSGNKKWISTYKCALRLWPEAPAHSNQVLRYWLKPKGLFRERVGDVHRAGPDAYVTAFLLREMLLLTSVEQLVVWSSEPALPPKCPFGRHRGKSWPEIPLDYLQWVMRSDMDDDAKYAVSLEIKRRGAR